jgi:Fuc2NAc and GlcNAc transferase
VLAFLRPTLSPLTGALALGGVLVALSGWLDDHGRATPLVRLALHFGAATALVLGIGVPGAVSFGVVQAPLGLLAAPLLVIGVVWLVNLYNFMDGLDGIAGTQAIVAGLGMGAMLLTASAPDLALLSLGVAAATVGFLRWNWPPARIFMGDVGSALLGFAFAAIALAGSLETGVALPLLLLPLGPFIADASVTLARRLVRGERIHLAHRRHLYQRLAQGGWSHRRIAVATGLVSLGLSGLALWGVGSDGRTSVALALGLAALLIVGGVLSRSAVGFDEAPGSQPPG